MTWLVIIFDLQISDTVSCANLYACLFLWFLKCLMSSAGLMYTTISDLSTIQNLLV